MCSVVVVIMMLLIGRELSAGIFGLRGPWGCERPKSVAKEGVDQGYRHVTGSTQHYHQPRVDYLRQLRSASLPVSLSQTAAEERK